MASENNNDFSFDLDLNDQTKKDTDSFSLESILAEIKGSAFINGEKRTPPEILEAEAERILREAAIFASPEQSQTVEQPQQSLSSFDEQPLANQSISPEQYNEIAQRFSPSEISPDADHDDETDIFILDSESIYTDSDIPTSAHSSDDISEPQLYEHVKTELKQAEHDFLEPEFSEVVDIPITITPLDGEEHKNIKPDISMPFATVMEDTALNQQSLDVPSESRKPFDFMSQDTMIHDSLLGGEKKERSVIIDQSIFDDQSDEQSDDYVEEEVYEEPRLKDAAVKFAKTCNSISLRLMPATAITFLMLLITLVAEAGMIVPFGIGTSLAHTAGTLILLQLIVMMLCVDILIRGVDFLVRGVPNAETLVLFSCVFSIVSAAFTIISGTALMLPFCAVSAITLVCATYGERFQLRAMTDTLKTAAGSAEPYGAQAEYNTDINKSVFKKAYNRTEGFYNNLMQPDITEHLYRYAAPVLLIAVLLLTILIVMVNGVVENSLHIMAALLAAAAPFSALLSFSVPYAIVAKASKKSGAAIAGWGGADDISYTDGVCVTDDDLFPAGTLRLSGVKVYDGVASDKAIRYTASVIITSGSGLATLFTEVLKNQGMSPLRVEKFEYQESGVDAVVRGEKVSIGSAAFMNLIGVMVPDDANMKNALYTAVDNELIAMFTVEYKPLPSVQNALITMLKWRIDLYFAMRDFNITPAMVGQKFKVPFESFVFISVKDSYAISDPYSGKQGRMASILIREGLGPLADAVTGGRLLRVASWLGTILSVISAALGVFLMFLMCWSDSYISATPGNLIVFMSCMLVTVLIVCGYVRLRK
ncbi:MAG: hypothetical protein LBC71_08050 [Oscillospiraceae bacterium]|nr:hypothetical protein [Oscillospiraceae bacterium]